MSSSGQIKWGAILSYISIALNIITSLLYIPWMVDTVGKSQYGLYTLANSVITLFLMDFGLSAATVRYLSGYNAEGNCESAEQFLGAVYRLYLLLDAMILAALTAIFFLLDRIFVNLTETELEQLRVVYAICAFFGVFHFPFGVFNGVLTAYEKFISQKLAELLNRLLHVLLTVAALLLGYGVYALAAAHAAAGILTAVLKYLFVRKTVPVKVRLRSCETGMYPEIFRFSFWKTATGLAERLVFPVIPSILGIVADSSAIAVFGIVYTIESYAISITTAVSGLFMPEISRTLAGPNSTEELNRLFLRVGRFQYGLNGLIVAGFAVVGRNFISLWIGEAYACAYWGILLVLIPGLFYNALQIAHTMMVAVGKMKVTALISLATGIANICCVFPLAKYWGATGACASVCVAYLFRAVISNFAYGRVLPLDMLRFAKACYLPMSLPIVFAAAGGMAMNCWIPDSGWGVLLIKVVITVFLYGVSTCFCSLQKQERSAIFCYPIRYIKKRLS